MVGKEGHGVSMGNSKAWASYLFTYNVKKHVKGEMHVLIEDTKEKIVMRGLVIARLYLVF